MNAVTDYVFSTFSTLHKITRGLCDYFKTLGESSGRFVKLQRVISNLTNV
mgnify:CR=1 FL=1